MRVESAPVSRIVGHGKFRLFLRDWAWLPIGLLAYWIVYFAPALLSERLLAPGDGAIYYFAFFDLSLFDLWNDDLLSGAPVVADIQAQTLYPLRWLAPTFNALVISAYFVAAIGAFGLAYVLTRSRLASLTAALVFSSSGFMVAHLGHVSIVHAAAWVPALLWAVASLRREWPWGAVAGGALAASLTLLGGHPQISVMGLMLAGAFAVYEIVGVTSSCGVRCGAKVLARVMILFGLGAALAAPTLVSTLESAATSVRGSWSLAEFTSFSHTAETLRVAFFPNLYGAHGSGPYGPYHGPWNLTELALYAGLIPWLLSMAALVGWRENRAPLFWCAVLLLGLTLTLGAETPLGRALYELPVVGRFRAQARFGLIVVIALSVLSAYGMAALLRGGWTRKRKGAFLALIVAAGLCMVAMAFESTSMPEGWRHPAILVPLVFLAGSLWTVLRLVQKPGFNAGLTAIVLVAMDLASFGWFYEWRDGGPQTAALSLDARARSIIARLAEEPGRVLPLGVEQQGFEPLRPNVNVHHGVASVVGYGPLLSSRYAQYTGANTIGGFATVAPDAPLLDVLGVRWATGNSQTADDSQLLGIGCGANGNLQRVRARLDAGLKPAAVRIVSHLACAQAVADGEPIAEVRVLDQSGAVLQSLTLDAGEETAEWAYDRSDVRATIAHARPPVAESFDAGGVTGLWFGASWKPDLSLWANRARFIEIAWRAGAPILRVKSLSLMPADGSTPVRLTLSSDYDSKTSALSPAISAPGLPPLRERTAFGGMAWGVCEARPAQPSLIATALASREGAAAAHFDPFKVALVETGQVIPLLDCRAPPALQLIGSAHGFRELSMRSAGRSLLVLSESYSSGWRASVDGVPVHVVPVNGLVLGIAVPDGEHRVVVRYVPRLFELCVAAALLSLVVVLVLGLLTVAPGITSNLSKRSGKAR